MIMTLSSRNAEPVSARRDESVMIIWEGGSADQPAEPVVLVEPFDDPDVVGAQTGRVAA